MSHSPKVYVAGMGMITALGGSALTTAVAVRARRKGLRISDEYKNAACKPITMAPVPDAALPEFMHELETSEDINVPIGRMLLMASVALEEVMASYPGHKPLPLILAGPTAYAGQEVPFSHGFIDLLSAQTDIEFDRGNSRLITTGRSGVLAGIDIAMKYLNLGTDDYVLVGGVDSYQDPDLLWQLDEQDRIKAEETPDGFIPGEAAGFLLLTSKPERAKRFGGYKISLYAPGLANEPGHLYSDETYTGSGLADALRLAIGQGDGQAIQTVYSSMNGEHFWAKEYGVAMLRNKDAFSDNVSHEHPADCFGDIGAAMGAVLIGVAGLSMARSGKLQHGLVYCSSDQAQRAALCIRLEA